jgi:hypothetical protein
MEYNESNSSVLIDAARKYKHNDIFKYLFESIVAKLKELAPEPIATSIDTNILLPPDLCDQTLEDGYQSDGTDNTVCLECPSVTEFVLSQCSLCAKGNPDLLRFILQYIEKQKLVEEKIMDINSRDKEGRSILEYTNKWEVIAINSQKDCGINNENQRITNPSTIEAVMDHSNNEDVDTRETLTRTFSL